MTSFSNSPNPQFERKSWLSLNGEWDFGFQKAKHSYKFSKDAGFACDIHKNQNTIIKSTSRSVWKANYRE